MSTAPLYNLTIEQAAAGLAAGNFSSRELTQACLDRITATDGAINAYIRVEPELALRQAEASDQRRQQGKARGPLDGVPYNLKDVYATTDSPTTAASHILDAWQAPYNATVYQCLQTAGAVLLGKTNTDEFTMGASTETSYYGVTRNPWDTTRVSGGSSGGPAASVAAHQGIFSIGTDTGGSIRQPAAFCGVTGVRPTYGRISRFGEIAMASSLDQTGPLTKTVRDAALVTAVLAGQDPLDATSSAEPVPDYLKILDALPKKQPLQGRKIGIAPQYFGEGVDPAVEAQVRAAITVLETLGATTVELSLPTIPSALAAYYILAPAEVSSNMARYDGIRYGYSVERHPGAAKRDLYAIYAESRAAGIGAEVRRRIMLGTHVLSAGYYDAYYKKAEAVRQQVRQEFDAAFTQVDAIVAPVSPHVAFPVGDKVNDPLAMYKEDVLTVPLNIGGIPGLSVPCGLVNGLPVGLQIMAGRFQEATLFSVAAAYQTATAFHLQFPEIREQVLSNLP